MVVDFQDEVLCETLNHVLSGLLPHEKYNPESFSMLYPTLVGVMDRDAARGLYFVFFVVLEKYYSLQTAVNADDFKINITKERFEHALANNLPDLILEPNLEVQRLMNEEGKSGDISIPTVQNEAMGVVFAKAMALYDVCYDLAQTYEDSMAYIVDLKDNLKANIIETGMQMQRAIMSTGLRYGRKFYRGTSGWVEFSQQLVREVSELNSNTQDDLVCDSLDVLTAVEGRAVSMTTALAKYGIPQLDDKTPMLCNRLMVLVAKENTGKTKVIIHLIASLIRAGVAPYLACGETKPSLMFMQIVSSYIYQEYGMYFETRDLSGEGFAALSPQDKEIVQLCKARVAQSGVIISDSLEYDNVLPAFTEAFTKGCRAFFVDHSQSLRGRKGRKIGDLVTSLALDCREFKNTYPAFVCVTSQPSTNLKDSLQREQTTDIQQSPTAQSSSLSQEADELFILSENDYLRKQNLLQWLTFKRRDAERPAPFYIRKLFHVASYLYDPNLQGGDVMDDDMMASLQSALDINIDEDDDDAEELQNGLWD